ncbi:MAG: exonuclease V gamma subunit, partial [Bradymonadia bacterium]
ARDVFALGGRVADSVAEIRGDDTERRVVLGGDANSALSGTIDGVFGRRRVAYRVKKKDDGFLLDAWLRHLALCAHSEVDRSFLVHVLDPNKSSRQVGIVEFGPVGAQEAAVALDEWRREFALGLRGESVWEPGSAMAFVWARVKGKEDSEAFAAAESGWRKALADPDAQRWWPDGPLFDEARFADTASRLAAPMVVAQEGK